MKKVFKYLFPVFSLIVWSGCSDFFDINKDPNNPTDARLDQIILTPQVMIFDALGSGPGGLSDISSQFVHHTVQRNPTTFYFMDGNEFANGTAWADLYNGALEDLNIIIDKAGKQGANNYLGVAKLLKAYSYSMLVDIFGVAPYTEFGQGVKIPYPKYDSGEDIYAALFPLIDEAKADLAKTSPIALGAQDQIYGGTADSWIRFANSLKLKLYNQIRLTPMYNATAVSALLTEDKFINKVSGGFRLRYTSSNAPENRNPYYVSTYQGPVRNYIDPYFFMVMTGNSNLYPLFNGITDPRIPYYFYNQLKTGEAAQNPVAYQNGNFLSIWSASFNIDPKEGFDQGNSQTLAGLYPCGGPYDNASGVNRSVTSGLAGAGYQRLYPYFAQLYTRAELALTKATGEDPVVLLNAAMQASFEEVNEIAGIANAPLITQGTIDTYKTAVTTLFTSTASVNQKLEILMAQKWIANFGNGLDPYTDYRRTGYPVMFDAGTDNNPVTVLNRNYPVSFPLNAFDLKVNPNAPKDRDPGSTKIFWDIN